MRRILLFAIFLLGVTAASGQYTSIRGRFQVDEIKGCAPFTITITNANVITSGECTSGVGGRPCLMDFQGDGTVEGTNVFTFPYSTPGKYYLKVLYQSFGYDSIAVTVVENVKPAFELYTCLGNQVSIKVTDKAYDTYLVDFNNDGTVETVIPNASNQTAQHSYGVVGTYNVSVRGKNLNAANNCTPTIESYQTVAVIPPPSITAMTAIDANNLQLDMTTGSHILNKLEIAVNNGATFQTFRDIYQATTVTIPSLQVDDSYYCFKLRAYDPCANNYYDNGAIICSQDFDVAFNNGSNVLSWKTATTGLTSVDIKRNNAQYSNRPGPVLGFTDNDFECNVEYTYQIVENYAGATSTSLKKTGIGKLTATYPAINNVTSIVRAGAELSWVADPLIKIDKFEVLKDIGNGLFPHAAVPASPYTDASYDYAAGACYQVNYTDACNNRSDPGIIACPMVLAGAVDDSNAVSLSWNSYKGYNQGVSGYRVSKYTKDGTLLGEYPTTDTTFMDFDPADNHQIVIYTITAFANEAGILKSISNNITIEKPVRLILPTAFTPNGDGINPTFTISGKFVSKMTLQIFDRWGVLVFSSDKNEAWDGTKNGRAMPESAYVWKAEVQDTAGNVFTKEGTVILLRPGR